MEIKILNQLKKQLHKDIGLLQDEVMDILISCFPETLVFHGGTSIWRCYNGKRFSEDLDFYLNNEKYNEELLKEKIKSAGLTINKIKTTDNVVFSKITAGKTEIRVEIRLLLKTNKIFTKKTITEYQRINGTTTTIYALSIDHLIIEKAQAYKNRKLIRDVYDVYFLSTNNIKQETKQELKEIINNWEKPIDEENLKTIIYTGIAPKYTEMLYAINRRI